MCRVYEFDYLDLIRPPVNQLLDGACSSRERTLLFFGSLGRLLIYYLFTRGAKLPWLHRLLIALMIVEGSILVSLVLRRPKYPKPRVHSKSS